MRFIIALFAGAVLSLPTFAAQKAKTTPASKVKSTFRVHILSYNELVALPQAKRMEYVRDLASLMVRMERANSRFEVADNGMTLEDLKYQIAELEQWFQFLPEADARSYQRNPRQTGEATGVLTWGDGQWVCGNGYEVDLSIPGCLKVSANGTTMYDVSAREHNDSFQPCPGMVEIPHPDPSAGRDIRGCMTSAGFGTLAPERRAAIMDVINHPNSNPWYDPNDFMRSTKEYQKQIAYGSTGGVAPGEQSVTATAGTPSATAPDSTTPAAPAPAPAAAGAATASSAPPAAGTPAASTTPPVTAAATPPAGKPAEPAKPEVANPPQDPQADACIPEPASCEEPTDAKGKKDREDAIAQFRKTAKFKGLDANLCVAGGFIRQYTSSTKRAGTCQPRSSWIADTKCKKPNEIMCNPVLFCHTVTNLQGKERPQWFCVDRKKGESNPQWTAACAEELKKRLSEKQKYDFKTQVNGKEVTKSTPEQVAKACDPKDLAFPADIKREWDDTKKGLEQLVNVWCAENEGFKALFCRECQIIKAQLYAMTKKATGSGCSKPEPGATSEAEKPKETEGDTATH